MNDKYIIGCIILLMLCFTHNQKIKSQTSIYGDFPYYQPFSSSTKPSEVEIVTAPAGSSGNAASFTVNGVQLTPAATQRFGGIFIKNRQFNASQGIIIEFEYTMSGGTGADGMSVFLFDASVTNPSIGAPGSGIGYTYNRANNTYSSFRTKGLSGAYLGIALDSYGNFKQRRWQGEARVNGIPGLTTSSEDRYASNITLRGAQGGNAQYTVFGLLGGMETGYTGYPVLISQPTKGKSLGWKLNDTNGTYTDIATYQGDFNLRGGQSSYRKAIIELYPVTGSNGFLVSVSIQHDNLTTTVINNFHYKASLVYSENAYTSSGDFNAENPGSPSSTTTTLNASIPSFLRIGFAASTGGYTDIHLLKKLKITIPGASQAFNDQSSTRQGIPVNINPLDNDIGYTGTIVKNQTGSKDYLNSSTFRFCDAAGNSLGTTDGNGAYYTTTEGIWQFNFSTKKLSFTPAGHFLGTAKIQYSIKAGRNNESPYSDEAYRSLPATVEIKVLPPEAVISNKRTTSIVRW